MDKKRIGVGRMYNIRGRAWCGGSRIGVRADKFPLCARRIREYQGYLLSKQNIDGEDTHAVLGASPKPQLRCAGKRNHDILDCLLVVIVMDARCKTILLHRWRGKTDSHRDVVRVTAVASLALNYWNLLHYLSAT
jgi:hypothetical protein